jgi:hypothetical protein
LKKYYIIKLKGNCMTTLAGLVAIEHSPYTEVRGDQQLARGTQVPPALQAAIGASADEGKALSLAGRVAPQGTLPLQPLPGSLAVYKTTGTEPLMVEPITLLRHPQDYHIALASVEKDHNTFKFLNQRFRATPTIVLASVRKGDASQLAFADVSLLSNPDFMLEATKINYGALRYGSLLLRRNPIFILEAGKIDSRALHYASPGLKRNPHFIGDCAKLTGIVVEPAKAKPRAKPEFTHPDFTEIEMGSARIPCGPLPQESVESSSLPAGSKRGREKPDSTLSTCKQIDMVRAGGGAIKKPRASGSTAMKARHLDSAATKGALDPLLPEEEVGRIKKYGYLAPHSKKDSYLGEHVKAALAKYSLAHVSVEAKYSEAYMAIISKVQDISDVDDYLAMNLKDYEAMMQSPIRLPTFLHVGTIREMGGNLGVFARENIAPNTFLGCYSGKFLPRSEITDFDYAVNIFDYDVDAADEGNYLRYANHSADHPNVEIRYAAYTDEKQTKRLIIAFYSIHSISKGEQILFPYGDAYDWSHVPEGKPIEVTPQTFMLDTATGEISKIAPRARKR